MIVIDDGTLVTHRQVKVNRGGGHWVQQERPSETNEALLGFLGGVGW